MEVVACIAGFFTDYKDAFDVLKNIGLLIVGAIGIRFLARRANAQEISADSAKRQADTAEKGHVTDRYIKAIDQLGAMHDKDTPNVEVRLGGIYGLEQVAKESTELYPQIIEVLTAYVRTNAVDTSEKMDEKDDEGNKIMLPHKPKADVQAVLNVLGRRKKTDDDWQFLDLSGAFLAAYSFTRNYSDVIFRGADLSGAVFHGANLFGAIFDDANCTKADFEGANCMKANFIRAVCTQAVFRRANCTKASFYGADCTRADFRYANCTQADFVEANCTGATIMDSISTGASFSWGDCTGVNFKGTNCTEVNFEGTNCTETSFYEVNCSKADFEGANCTEASFKGTNCTEANFEGATCKRANFEGADCTRAIFHDVNLEGVDFSLAKVPPPGYESDADNSAQDEENDMNTMGCLCCEKKISKDRPRVCPECGHVFKGNGWDGIDAHWRAKHEEVMPYEGFWKSLCSEHKK